MENKKSILAGSIIASAVIGLSSITTDASALTTYRNLGSGAEVRSSLLNTPSAVNTFELACGEKGAKTEEKTDAKSKDGKCGEGKCGDKKKDGKSKEGKCGEGKCGDKKKDGKSKEGKCGEGKCGDKKKDAPKDPK